MPVSRNAKISWPSRFHLAGGLSGRDSRFANRHPGKQSQRFCHQATQLPPTFMEMTIVRTIPATAGALYR
jgi:hypothetical protein